MIVYKRLNQLPFVKWYSTEIDHSSTNFCDYRIEIHRTSMNVKPKTKLMKLVCQRAQTMRSAYRDPSQAKKIDATDRKPLPVSKIGERFRSKITELSVEKSWPLIRKVSVDQNELFHRINVIFHSLQKSKEWIVVRQIYLFKQRKQCLCGKDNLKFATYLKNKKNNNEIVAGNCCILTLTQ